MTWTLHRTPDEMKIKILEKRIEIHENEIDRLEAEILKLEEQGVAIPAPKIRPTSTL